MPDFPSIEAPFVAFAVSDDDFAAAYEVVGAKARAGLKKCIAVHYESLGEPLLGERRERRFRQGFVLVDDDAGPCPAVTYVCDDDYPQAEAFLAALMPALMAGARPNVLFRRRSGAPGPHLLTALELAGGEDAWHLDDAAVLEFFRLGAPGALARLVLLGAAPFGDDLIAEAHRAGTMCRTLFGALSAPEDMLAPAEPGTRAFPAVIPFWPHLDPGWFRLRTRLASIPNRK